MTTVNYPQQLIKLTLSFVLKVNSHQGITIPFKHEQGNLTIHIKY